MCRAETHYDLKDTAHKTMQNVIVRVNVSRGAGTAKSVHSDGGGEFMSKPHNDWLKSVGVSATFSAEGTPEHNSLVERAMRTIVSSSRCMLHAAAGSKFLTEAQGLRAPRP